MVCESSAQRSWFHPSRLSAGSGNFFSYFGAESASLDSASAFSCEDAFGPSSPTEKKRRTRGFDMADVVERGCAREVADDFTVPLKKSSKLWRFTVIRSTDRTEFKLYSHAGNFLMVARTNFEKRQVDFYLYHPDTELFDAEDPVFRMTFSAEKKSWLLRKTFCDCCTYKNRNCASQELVSIEHFQEPIGEGLFNIMHVHIPQISENTERGVTWCLMNDFPSLATLVDGKEHEQALPMANVKPIWNHEASSLVLEFKGRKIIPSAKNFQLSSSTLSTKEEVITQFAKLGPQTFALDVKFPLTIVQAFAISISTMFWE